MTPCERYLRRAAVAPESRGKPVVLVVDDEPMVRRVMVAALRERYLVLEAANGREALALVEVAGDGVSIVVTDVRMPTMDGPALAGALARRERPPAILFVSGFAGEGELPGPLLQKPFLPLDLLAAVARLAAAPR